MISTFFAIAALYCVAIFSENINYVKAITCNENEVLNPCVTYCNPEPDCPYAMTGAVRECAPPPPDYECGPACVCAPGFVRIDTKCVSPDLCCPGPNQEAIDCPVPCDDTCDLRPAPNCKITPCVLKGCRCKAGYVRDFMKNCILKADCKKICRGENEVYNECGSCDPTCKNPNIICPQTGCIKGCFCIKGFVRDNKRKCIDPKNCVTITPFPCNVNEHFTDCVPWKEASCTDYNILPAHPNYCKPGCTCDNLFVRYNKVCIARRDCKRKKK
ncbi:zonadhesin-like [Arctopsyche grandis]|uniref:zonadhesin-like n=1 Tax=Arctopsyche grandis TaxID=121162 RepID=UPI00406D96AA